MLQIEGAAQVPAGHSLFDNFASHWGYRAKEKSDCGIIVVELNMLRLAGCTQCPLYWLLPMTDEQKHKYKTCVVQVSLSWS